MQNLIGNWTPLLEEEFFKPYMHDISKKIEEYKTNPFLDIHPKDNNYFINFLKCPLDKCKVIYIVNNNKFHSGIKDEIERDLFDGFNISLSTTLNYDWLLKQGIFLFPRALSWGSNGDHREWYDFTEQVLLKLSLERNVLFCTSANDVKILMFELRSLSTIIPQDIGCWYEIDKWIKENYNESITWTP